MDPVTQGAIGAAAAQAVFGRKLPRAAALIGFAAGMAADLDVFIPTGGDPVGSLIYHRHFTHSLIFIPIGGLIASLPFIWWKQFKEHRLEVFGAATLAYATHGLLDAFTNYGTLLFYPFSDYRVSWDLIGIIDPAFTVPLLIGMIWTIFTKRPQAARIGLLTAALYMCFAGWQHYRAEEAQQTLAETRGHPVQHSRVMPAPGSLLMWRSVYVSGERLYVDGARVPYFGETMAREGGSAPIAAFEDLPEEIRVRPDTRRVFDVFSWFADGLISPVEGETNVFGDQRFGSGWDGLTPLWGMDFGSSGTDEPERWRPPDSGRRGFAGEIWRSLFQAPPGYSPVGEIISAPEDLQR
jgi:inner membrane protein